MPTYQYACTQCHERLEAVQSFTDAALTECPVCGGALRKVFSAVGVVFKGSGFYKNDSRPAAAGEKGAAEGGDGAKKDAGEKGGDGAKKETAAAASSPGGSSPGGSSPGGSSPGGSSPGGSSSGGSSSGGSSSGGPTSKGSSTRTKPAAKSA